MTSTRGRAACNGCRSRKQKCDEKRPACSRCIDIGRQCIWPTQQKRGPAKGYVEALENRLLMTENALLRLYSVADVGLLSAAFDSPDSHPLSLSNETFGRRVKESLKASESLAEWDNLPLNTAEDVHHWAGVMLHRPHDTGKPADTGRQSRQQVPRVATLQEQRVNVLTHPLRNDRTEVAQILSADVDMQSGQSTTALTANDGSGGINDVLDMSDDFKQQYLW